MRVFAISALLLVAGCMPMRGHHDGTDLEIRKATPTVELSDDHACAPGCLHYRRHARWYVMNPCDHHPACGHYWTGEHWVITSRTRPKSGHLCNRSCTHYRFDGHWYDIFAHAHRPGCGHEMRDGIWTAEPR